MIPVTQKHACLATILFGSGNKPIYKIAAILIVCQAVGLEPMMYVGADRCLSKQICHHFLIVISQEYLQVYKTVGAKSNYSDSSGKLYVLGSMTVTGPGC
jgi:hypothetical protein